MSDEELETSEIPFENQSGRLARDPDPRPSAPSLDGQRGVALSVLWWIEEDVRG